MVISPLLFALAITLLIFIGNLFELLAQAGSTLGFATTLPPEFVTYLENWVNN